MTDGGRGVWDDVTSTCADGAICDCTSLSMALVDAVGEGVIPRAREFGRNSEYLGIGGAIYAQFSKDSTPCRV